MRLIDADNLVQILHEALQESGSTCTKALLTSFACTAICAAPEVNAEPVKHGEWVNDNGLYRCTACGELWTIGWADCIPIQYMYKERPYCPKCGAKMDGERKEDEGS